MHLLPVCLRLRRLSVWLIAAFIVLAPAVPAQAQSSTSLPAANPPDWLEPRGLDVVDLVGLVPEPDLRDTILSYSGDGGIAQYIAGQRNGDQVTITARLYGRYQVNPSFTLITGLGQWSFSDHWPATVPAAQVHIFSQGRDITDKVINIYYYPSGEIKPIRGTSPTQTRYAAINLTPAFGDGGALQLPGNMGSTIFLSGQYTNLTATFVFQVERKIAVTMLGSQSFVFHSYIGVGDPGQLGALQNQMSRYGSRHDKFPLSIPSGAEYVLLKYPPTPVSPYIGANIDTNIRQPSSGSYRLSHGVNALSVDHEATMGLPLQGQWQDADQAGGEYLNRLTGIDTLASPEYFVPAGIGYDPCMKDGGCPQGLLDDIYNTTMDMTLYYFSVERVATGLDRIPLRQVGPDWRPSASAASSPELPSGTNGAFAVEATGPTVFLPLVMSSQSLPPDNLPPDNPDGCPCGWFTVDGRMLDFIP